MNFSIAHIELKQANNFISLHHRHHKPVTGHRFSIAAIANNTVVGVAIAGRPVSRITDQNKNIIEILRCCTNGTPNACSFLYAASARAATALGYKKIQTFILISEPGTSLTASGWTRAGVSKGGDWNRPSRGNRSINQPLERKIRWEKALS